MFPRPFAGRQWPARSLVSAVLVLISALHPAIATTHGKSPAARGELGGFVRDVALARVLGETLFRDTVDVMSDSPALTVPAGPVADNSAVAQVARTVLAHRSLDKYLWLIRQAFSDELWKGGDRTRIENHFPLIWRTSILLYESTLDASPHRVRVCTPTDDQDVFDCRDELSRPKMIPIPAQAPLLQRAGEPVVG